MSFRELLAYPLALPGVHSTLHKLIDIYCSREGVACKSVLRSATLETLLGFTLASDAVTFCGELVVRRVSRPANSSRCRCRNSPPASVPSKFKPSRDVNSRRCCNRLSSI
ncbi:hypothetical protein [Burkholderia stabilis]|uniref:hypothetical protein n=1 Tax=Burkholderia stabilis TaxID=95485 RepID=UPI0023EA6C82|nr:hypothetical protein [Burkholderia stabilis]